MPTGRRSALTAVSASAAIGVVSLLVTSLSLAGPASAHTELLAASPGPAERAGGTVDFVDLAFLEPVSDVDIQLEDPSGRPVEGRMVVADGQIIRYEMPALSAEGRYIVRYTMTSADRDFTQSAYFFTYEADALQPARLGDADLPSNRNRNIAIAASVVFAAAVIGLVLIMLSRLERRRAVEAER